MADIITALLAGSCAVLLYLTIVILEAMPLDIICKRKFAKRAVPLFLIVAFFTYLII